MWHMRATQYSKMLIRKIWQTRKQLEEVREIFWKLIIRFLQCNKKNYLRAVSTGKSIFIVDIHQYVPVEQEIQQWSSVLENPRA